MEFDAIKEQLKGSLLQEKQQEAYKSKINQLQILFPVLRGIDRNRHIKLSHVKLLSDQLTMPRRRKTAENGCLGSL